MIDDSATNPEYVRLSTELLKGKVLQYLFTSSTGVYYPYLKRGLDETTMPHTTMVDPKDGSESFGVQKAQCEEIVRAAFGKGSIVVRPELHCRAGRYQRPFSLLAAATREGRPYPGALERSPIRYRWSTSVTSWRST